MVRLDTPLRRSDQPLLLPAVYLNVAVSGEAMMLAKATDVIQQNLAQHAKVTGEVSSLNVQILLGGVITDGKTVLATQGT